MLGKLNVTIVEARNLTNQELFGFSDPYATIELGTQKKKTTVIKKNLNPRWNETFQLDVLEKKALIHVTIYDKDMFKDDFMGDVHIAMEHLFDGREYRDWYKLQKRRQIDKVSGDVFIALRFEPTPAASSHPSIHSPVSMVAPVVPPRSAPTGSAQMPRCSSCGGWGVGLVLSDGMCKHCASIRGSAGKPPSVAPPVRIDSRPAIAPNSAPAYQDPAGGYRAPAPPTGYQQLPPPNSYGGSGSGSGSGSGGGAPYSDPYHGYAPPNGGGAPGFVPYGGSGFVPPPGAPPGGFAGAGYVPPPNGLGGGGGYAPYASPGSNGSGGPSSVGSNGNNFYPPSGGGMPPPGGAPYGAAAAGVVPPQGYPPQGFGQPGFGGSAPVMVVPGYVPREILAPPPGFQPPTEVYQPPVLATPSPAAAAAAAAPVIDPNESEDDRLFREFLANEFRCNVCQRGGDPDRVFMCSDEHKTCHGCLQPHIVHFLPTASEANPILCPVGGCSRRVTDDTLQLLLSREAFEEYSNRGLMALISADSNLFRCPGVNCGHIYERVGGMADVGDVNELGPDGKPLSAEALAHKREFRFRCRNTACNLEFCSLCAKTPYHVGFTCDQQSSYEGAKKCRFCASQLTAENTPRDAARQPPAVRDVCSAQECMAKRTHACKQMTTCGHPCAGVNGAVKHFCFAEGCATAEQHQQTGDDFCNICWVEDLRSAPSLILDCGHTFHYGCLQDKISRKWPTVRITFGFLECPLCKTFIKHEMLADELKPLNALREDVENKALARLTYEGLDKDARLTTPGDPYFKNPKLYAMNRFCYYMCFKCKKPYFGGMRQCDAGERNQEFKPEELVCGGCAGGALAQKCDKHGTEFIEYKCAFCCSVGTWFCWGKTHFCDDCHTKQNNGDYLSRKPKNELPQCPGPDRCPLKRWHPPTGEEFSLGCMMCINAQNF